ncbi:MAG: sulfatase-like hydrolase/transferase [Gemmataceae bacterium]|nr:sulfatase-like hydrolase/transferase [Gemmataceae bacterium]MCI0742190.1 sulfatase-like hydrolase/transferase [Gemmataceae bacterium]
MKLLLLDVPALHLGYVGCYGNDWIATPNLDRLATRCVVFDQHFADDITWRSTFATGRHVFPTHSGLDPEFESRLENDFREHSFVWKTIQAKVDAGLAKGLKEIQKKTEKTLAALAKVDSWVLQVELPSLAPPWNLPEDALNIYCDDTAQEQNGAHDDLDRLKDNYAAVVTYFDAWLENFLDALSAEPWWNESLVCVRGTSSFPLGEHGYVGPVQAMLHEETVHLPLWLRLPGAQGAGSRLLELTQPVDLFPTVLEYFCLPIPPGHGHSLWPLLKGEVETVRPHTFSSCRVGDEIEWSLRTRDWAFLLPIHGLGDVVGASGFVEGSRPRLYVKPDDRWEVNDVSHHHMDLCEDLEKTLRDFAAECGKG